jgi:nucleotide-binding universal stress UspA family protein
VNVLEHVTRAVEGTSFELHWRLPSAAVKRAERELRRQSEARLAETIKPFKGSSCKLRTDTLSGVAFVEIIRSVQKRGYDLVLAGTRGLSGAKRLVLGSTAERLVRKCPCPVWVVKGDAKTAPRSVLAPIDFTEVSLKSLRIASRLALLFGSSLDVLHAVDFRIDAVLQPPSEFGVNEPHARRREVVHAATRRMHDIVSNHVPAQLEVSQRLGLGEPSERIIAAARRTKPDLIVMGSVGRVGIPGFFIGNTAEKVLRRSDCSILAVKPDGFVSPVHLGGG